jgi:hypothetical protein
MEARAASSPTLDTAFEFPDLPLSPIPYLPPAPLSMPPTRLTQSVLTLDVSRLPPSASTSRSAAVQPVSADASTGSLWIVSKMSTSDAAAAIPPLHSSSADQTFDSSLPQHANVEMIEMAMSAYLRPVLDMTAYAYISDEMADAFINHCARFGLIKELINPNWNQEEGVVPNLFNDSDLQRTHNLAKKACHEVLLQKENLTNTLQQFAELRKLHERLGPDFIFPD